MEFDELKAIAYIKEHAGIAEVANYDDDDILLVIDTIFEYFEKYDENEDFDDDNEKVIAYVKKQLAKDKANAIDPAHVAAIVEAETAYENTLDD
ncbi:MAG: hypothetical protein Q4B68_06830 [Bacteroidales bacterium]|nr:hypothetical protein [Bacteroidales bacterium]